MGKKTLFTEHVLAALKPISLRYLTILITNLKHLA
jgi:hypothetical protein